jgi:hypothetical protein
MGAILAMILHIRSLIWLAGICLIAGCGTERQGATAQVFQGVKSLFQSGPATTPPGPDDLLTRDVIDQVVVPYAMVGIERRGAYASMTLAGTNRAHESWVTSDGAGIVLKNGVLTGTKGLGADLLTADLGGIEAMIPSAQGATTRVHRFLDGEGRIFAATYQCSLSAGGNEDVTIIGRTYATRLIIENCVSDQNSFENKYWIGRSDGVIWQSRQWVSAGVGHVLLLTLVPVAR